MTNQEQLDQAIYEYYSYSDEYHRLVSLTDSTMEECLAAKDARDQAHMKAQRLMDQFTK